MVDLNSEVRLCRARNLARSIQLANRSIAMECPSDYDALEDLCGRLDDELKGLGRAIGMTEEELAG